MKDPTASTSYLVIGGTGHTGAGVVRGLRARGDRALSATRTPKHDDDIRFDWSDPDTRAAIAGVRGIYLIAPPAEPDPAPLMTSLIDRAIAGGTRRFVLLSSSAVPDDAPGLGEVARHLRARAPEWAVLQPSWFMQNFLDPAHLHAQTIAKEKRIYTSTGDARVGFVDAEDIAAVAVHALTTEPPPNRALVITGPETLSYADVARVLGAEHMAITDAESRACLVASGMNEAYAQLLVDLDALVRSGAEDRVTSTVRDLTGRAPSRFADVARPSRVP